MQQASTQPPKPSADSLVQALCWLAAFFGRSAEPEQLTAGLPLNNGQLDIDHLEEAAARAGLALTAYGGGWEELRNAQLPAVVVDRDGSTVIVLGRHGKKLEVMTPGVAGKHWMSASKVWRTYNAMRYLARPVFHLDSRSLLYFRERPRRWFWDTLLANRSLYTWALFATLVLNIVGAVVPFYTMAVYDRVVPTNAIDSLWVLTIGVVVAMTFELIFKLIRSYLLEVAGRRADLALSSHIFSQALRLRAQARPASGGVLANTVRDFESVREFFTSSTLTVLGDLPFGLIYLGLVALIGGWLALVPLTVMVLAVTLTMLIAKPIDAITERNMRIGSQRTAHLFEVMNGLDTIKALGADAWARRKWEMLCTVMSQDNLKMREWTSLGNYGAATLFALDTVLLVMCGALMIAGHHLTMGQLIACSMLAGRALTPAGQVNALLMRWQQTRQSLQALEKIMTSPTDDTGAQMHVRQIRGAIQADGVSFGYSEGAAALRSLNLKINPGEKVGLIGRLGSGKSTLLRLLLNQYQPGQGSVRIDDIPVGDMHPLSLRRLVGYMPQDVMLFHGSVKDNILLGRADIDPDQLADVLRVCGVADILDQLEKGLDTPVGERGDRLSGGQRQAVALARALVHQPKLVLLDEPTSMMDPATEQFVLNRLKSHLQNSTVLLVTHRMAMLPLVERLLVFDRGQIVLDGPRDAVLARLAQGPVRPATAPANGQPAQGQAPAGPRPQGPTGPRPVPREAA